MDKLEQYRTLIENLLREIVEVTERSAPDTPQLRDKTVFDRRSDTYLIVREGWVGARRVNSNVVYLEILKGKIWIQADNTDRVIARELEKAGVPKSDIVLGFQPPSVRPYTEYAVA
jgi:hypothetical protein